MYIHLHSKQTTGHDVLHCLGKGLVDYTRRALSGKIL